jgi:hypothetical protein
MRDRGLLELGAGQNGAEWLELAMTDGEFYETLDQLRDLDCIGFKSNAPVGRAPCSWTFV